MRTIMFCIVSFFIGAIALLTFQNITDSSYADGLRYGLVMGYTFSIDDNEKNTYVPESEVTITPNEEISTKL